MGLKEGYARLLLAKTTAMFHLYLWLRLRDSSKLSPYSRQASARSLVGPISQYGYSHNGRTHSRAILYLDDGSLKFAMPLAVFSRAQASTGPYLEIL